MSEHKHLHSHKNKGAQSGTLVLQNYYFPLISQNCIAGTFNMILPSDKLPLIWKHKRFKFHEGGYRSKLNMYWPISVDFFILKLLKHLQVIRGKGEIK